MEVIILKKALVNISLAGSRLALGCTIVLCYLSVKKILILLAFICKHQAFPGPNICHWDTGAQGEQESGSRGRKVVYGELEGPVECIGTTSPSQTFLLLF